MISTERDNMEIPVIKEVTMQAIAAPDSIMAKLYGITEGQAGTIRREMKNFPKFKKGILNGGQVSKIIEFGEYLEYRGTHEWKKEMALIKKRKGAK